MLNFIGKYFKYVFIVLGVLLFALAAVYAIREHDARILAEQTVKESAARVTTLEQKVTAVEAAGQAKSAAIKRRAATVQTPREAIVAIPEVSAAPLNVRPLPDAPSAVAVEAVPLFQELSRCKVAGAELDTCTAKLDLQQQITAEKDIQVAALSNKGSFWKRLGKGLKVIGCAAGGGALGGLSKSPAGAGIGAGAGAALCSIF